MADTPQNAPVDDPTAPQAGGDYEAQMRKAMGVPDAAPTDAHPIRDFFHNLIHGTPETQGHRLSGAVQAAGRGVVGAAQQILQTTSDITGSIGDENVFGGISRYTGGLARGLEKDKEHLFGKATNDPLASLTEGAVQFTTGMIAAAPLKTAGALQAVAKFGVVATTVFDPYQAGLNELVARSPIPIAKDVAQLLSVKGDDSAIVARVQFTPSGLGDMEMLAPNGQIEIHMRGVTRIIRKYSDSRALRIVAFDTAFKIRGEVPVPPRVVTASEAGAKMPDRDIRARNGGGQ